MSYRLGIDVGGTFTDAVLLDEDTGEVMFEKVPTTPPKFATGIMNSIDRFGISLRKASFLAHGTTVVINAIIGKTGAKVGLITTKGFRDVLEIQRSNRPEMYDPLYCKPKPLVERFLRLEVEERLDSSGAIMKSLKEEEVLEAIKKFKENEVESIAVCLLNAYVNPIHELQIREIVKRKYPEAYLSLSTDITREYREYERSSTTVLNAYVMSVVDNYLRNLTMRLSERGFQTPIGLLVMESIGGVMTAEIARKAPINMVESGPAAGVIGMAVLGKAIGCDSLVSYDMGGTTAKCGMVYRGTPRQVTSYVVERYPVLVPALELSEIGAGGGSIAWIDSGGALHVGPQSSGAVPGPACYNTGGTEPTVTDADLLTGRLNPGYFLGGNMKIYPELSKKALQKIADYYKLDLTEAAYGVTKIVDTKMSGLLRAMTIRRGFDPRDFAIVAFGGAGGVHVMALAQELAIPTVVIPKVPGNFSAWGMLTADLKHDFVQTFVKKMEEIPMEQLAELYETLEKQGTETLKKEGVAEENMRIMRSMDVRYVGQEHTLVIPVSAGRLDEQEKKIMCDKFDDLHEQTYRHSAREEPKEIVAIRMTVIGIVKKPPLKKARVGTEVPTAEALKGKRPVYFEEEGGFIDCSIYERDKLLASNVIKGPAIVEEATSTSVIHPGQTLRVDEYGNLIVKIKGA